MKLHSTNEGFIPIPNRKHMKLMVKGFDREILYQLYRPTSKVAKLYFALRLYYISKLFCKETLLDEFSEILNLSQVYAILKGNNIDRQKFIAIESNGESRYFKKFAQQNTLGADDIRSECENLRNQKNDPDSKFLIPQVNSFKETDKYVCMETVAHYHTNDFCNEPLNFNLLNTFIRDFYKDYENREIEISNFLIYSEKVNNNLLSLMEKLGFSSTIKLKYSFSHGDFTCWNVKKSEGKYLLLDWEDISVESVFTDIIHFQFTYYTLVHPLNIIDVVKEILNNYLSLKHDFEWKDYILSLVCYFQKKFIADKIQLTELYCIYNYIRESK